MGARSGQNHEAPMNEPPLLFLNRRDLTRCLGMPEAIEAMTHAFCGISDGRAQVPLRSHLKLAQVSTEALLMPAYHPETGRFSIKTVSLAHGNPDRGLPLIHALLLLFDAETGRPLAVMDGEYLTALRTGAASGLATRLLARSDARVLAVIGAGAQARYQIEGVCAVRPIEQIFIAARQPENAEALAQETAGRTGIAASAGKVEDILPAADVICTATTSTSPVFEDAWVKPGTHINGIGAYRADMAEIPPETMERCRLIVDQREACLREAGDILIPMRAGKINAQHIHAELGEILSGRRRGRRSGKEITLFKSVGNAVQDLMVAHAAYEAACRLQIGTPLSG